MQHTGAGLLDVAAAVQLTLTSAPSSVDFLAGGSTADLTQRLVLRNVGKTADTYALSVAALQGGPTPSVTPDVVDLAPGGTAEVSVRWNGVGLTPRTYEGFIVARGATTDATTRIPYWYAASGAPAASIAVFEAPESGRASSRQEFLVRALDAAGLPVMTDPKVTVVSEGAGARVGTVESFDSRYPGFYHVEVNLSSERVANVFEVAIGSAKVRVTINGQ